MVIIYFQVIGIIGAFPEKLFKEGTLVNNFFTKEKLIYQDVKKYMGFGEKKKTKTIIGFRRR
jgi:hypothetical protein